MKLKDFEANSSSPHCLSRGLTDIQSANALEKLMTAHDSWKEQHPDSKAVVMLAASKYIHDLALLFELV